MKGPADIVREDSQIGRLRTRELAALVAGGGVQFVGVDVAAATGATVPKTMGVVELPTPSSILPSLPELVANAIIARLRADGLLEPPAPGAAEPERILISSGEAAALLGISRRALAKRVERHRVPGVVRTGRKVEFNKAKLIAGLDRRTRA